MPSYVAYIKTEQNLDPYITIKILNPLSTKLFFWQKHKPVKILLTRKGKTETIAINALHTSTDQALQLEGWEFLDTNNTRMSVSQLYLHIFSKNKNLQEAR